MPRKKAIAAKAVKPGKKKPVKKAPAKRAKRNVAKNLSYQKQIDHLYQTLTADCKKAIAANGKASKKLNAHVVKLNKALAANQKKLAVAEKQNGKTAVQKAQKACASSEKALVAAQQAVMVFAAEAQQLKQDLAQITAEAKLVADSRHHQPPAAAPKAPTAPANAPKTKTKAKKAEKVKPAFAEEDEENQLALVMEEDFMADDEAMKDYS
ncbi:MAG: hypothetical protein A3F10_05925 [Coxiella sp. RIFCSPHIGHO2_12_FULL_42_15]|nr:MAG: hypothetical protein A3F10_05925 [Coxiella sp. RIFCSPHIGHO2_12_FULL_42_15]